MSDPLAERTTMTHFVSVVFDSQTGTSSEHHHHTAGVEVLPDENLQDADSEDEKMDDDEAGRP
jgi:predicted RNA-binding protein with PIN domain